MYSTEVLARNTARFYDWEIRGRGWALYARPVPLEPEFHEFSWLQPDAGIVDDGRRHTILSRLLQGLTGQRPQAAVATQLTPAYQPPSPRGVGPEAYADLEVLIPPETKIGGESEVWLRSVSSVGERVAFELLGSAGSVQLRVATPQVHAASARGQLLGLIPAATVRPAAGSLRQTWVEADTEFALAVEFGLAKEFMLPLRGLKTDPDPLTTLVTAAAAAGKGEVILFQVLLEPVSCPWGDVGLSAITSPDEEPFFIDAPDFNTSAAEKLSAPLFAVVIRSLTGAATAERAAELTRGLAAALGQWAA